MIDNDGSNSSSSSSSSSDNTAPPLRLQVRLLRVPTLVPGAVAIDHSTRGLLVGGEPFFPVSWMTTMDAYGVAVMVAEMAEMARRGANSIMIYDLGAFFHTYGTLCTLILAYSSRTP